MYNYILNIIIVEGFKASIELLWLLFNAATRKNHVLHMHLLNIKAKNRNLARIKKTLQIVKYNVLKLFIKIYNHANIYLHKVFFL